MQRIVISESGMRLVLNIMRLSVRSLIEEFIPLFFDLGEGVAVGQLLVDGLREVGVSFLQDLELALHLLPAPAHPGRNEGEIAAELPQQAHPT